MINVEYKFDLLSEVINLSVIGQLNNVNFVYTNPAIIESVEIIKKNSIISRIKDTKEYKLDSHRILVKQKDRDTNESFNIVISDEIEPETITINNLVCSEISDNINLTFTNFLDSNIDSQSIINYYDRGFFKNLLNRCPNRLIDMLLEESIGFDSIFVSEDIYKEILKSNRFTTIISNKSIIRLVGRISNSERIVNVYSNPLLSDKVYLCKSNSISAIFNKNIKVGEHPSGYYDDGIEITTEYIFLKNDDIKRITIG